MNMNHFVLFAFIVSFVYVEQYDEIYRLTAELQDRNAQLGAQHLDIMHSKLYRQVNNQLQSVEAERDQLYAKLLEMSSDLKMYKNQAEREIYELRRNLEMEREKLYATE